MFCEMLDYNIQIHWFLYMSVERGGLDQWNFSRVRERLVDEDTTRHFFDAAVRNGRKADLLEVASNI